MTQFLIVLGMAVIFVGLAFAGLAIKAAIKKGSQLTTCSGGSTDGICGCGSNASSCSTTTE